MPENGLVVTWILIKKPLTDRLQVRKTGLFGLAFEKQSDRGRGLYVVLMDNNVRNQAIKHKRSCNEMSLFAHVVAAPFALGGLGK